MALKARRELLVTTERALPILNQWVVLQGSIVFLFIEFMVDMKTDTLINEIKLRT